jgi:hypothetical protein
MCRQSKLWTLRGVVELPAYVRRCLHFAHGGRSLVATTAAEAFMIRLYLPNELLFARVLYVVVASPWSSE